MGVPNFVRMSQMLPFFLEASLNIDFSCLFSFLSMKIHFKAKVLSEEFALVQLGMFLHSVSDARLIRN